MSARTLIVRTFVAGTALVALIGVMHAPIARPLLAALGSLCPVNRVTAAEVEPLQAAAARELRGTTSAPASTLVGLHLLRADRAAIEEWARHASTQCADTTRGLHYLSCDAVSDRALGRPDGDATDREVVIASDSRHRTIGVDILTRTAPASAARLATVVRGELEAAFGAPHEQHGTFDAPALAAPFQTAVLRYRFTDAVVTVMATNVPGSGVVVREQYLLLTSRDLT